MYIPKDPWTLQWRGWNLYSRGPGSQNRHFWGVGILRDYIYICIYTPPPREWRSLSPAKGPLLKGNESSTPLQASIFRIIFPQFQWQVEERLQFDGASSNEGVNPKLLLIGTLYIAFTINLVSLRGSRYISYIYDMWQYVNKIKWIKCIHIKYTLDILFYTVWYNMYQYVHHIR